MAWNQRVRPDATVFRKGSLQRERLRGCAKPPCRRSKAGLRAVSRLRRQPSDAAGYRSNDLRPAADKERLPRRPRRIDRRVCDRNRDQVDQCQRQADGDRRKACRDAAARGTKDDEEEESSEQHLDDQRRGQRIAAWRVLAIAIRREAAPKTKDRRESVRGGLSSSKGWFRPSVDREIPSPRSPA